MKYVEGETMKEHLNKMTDLAKQLEGIRARLSNQNIAVLILNSLPKSFKHLISTMESSKMITSEYVKVHLLQEELHCTKSDKVKNTMISKKNFKKVQRMQGERETTQMQNDKVFALLKTWTQPRQLLDP